MAKTKKQIALEKKQLRYVAQRKKQLKELHKLVYERNELNRMIRKLQKEMAGWDRGLLLME